MVFQCKQHLGITLFSEEINTADDILQLGRIIFVNVPKRNDDLGWLFLEKELNSLPTRQVGQVLVRVEPCIKVGVERVSLAKDLVGQSASRPDVRLGVVQHAAQPRLRTFDFRRHHRAVASLVHLSRQVRKLQSIRLVGQAAAEITDHQERVVYGKGWDEENQK